MKPIATSPENSDTDLNPLTGTLPALAGVCYSMDLQCTQAWGKILSQLKIHKVVGQPVTVVWDALAQFTPPPGNSTLPPLQTFREMCLAAIDGVERGFDFVPYNGGFYRVELLPLEDSGGGEVGILLIHNKSPEVWSVPTLQRFIEAAPDAMIVTDLEGQIIMANSQMDAMFGYAAGELHGQPVEVLLPARVRNRHGHHMRRYSASPVQRQMGTGLELAGITKHGAEFPVDISLSPIQLPTGPLIISAIRNISERKQIETELKEARDQLELRVKERTADLEHRNEELDAFAQTVAHDLKNPLAIMTGMAELMLQYYNELSDTELREYLALIARDGRRLDNIINELMALSSLQNVDPTLQPIDVAHVAEEAIQRLEIMIRQYQAQIHCQCDWPWATGYAPWIETVWVNYLSNAIKYGGESPVIELGADSAGNGMIRYWIKDNGIGLTEHEQEKLFTPFTRLSDIRVQGYGVGLSVVKRAVEKLGGQVGVESEVGQGSLFYFTLPAAEAGIQAPA